MVAELYEEEVYGEESLSEWGDGVDCGLSWKGWRGGLGLGEGVDGWMG